MFPQEQTPPRHVSARCVEQSTQALPIEPQSVAVGVVMHCAPAQQPLGQLAAEQPTQVPASHAWLSPQAAQAAPPVPQAVCATPGRQLPPVSQQPLGQVVALQSQVPASQVGPPVQAGRAPHKHVPFPPQVSAVDGLQATHPAPPPPQSASVVGVTQTPLLQQVAQFPG